MASSAHGLAISTQLEPMEAKLATELPDGPGWQFEPKWDGFRCLAFKIGAEVQLKAKSGKSLARFFPEMVSHIEALPLKQLALDGELVIQVDEELSFDALQMRLHPAESRIRKLAAETPSRLILFDCLLDRQGKDITDQPLSRRRAILEELYSSAMSTEFFDLSPVTTDTDKARHWLESAGGSIDGIVAKRLDEPYRAGERALLKIKKLRTADCVVGGFRYARGRPLVGSLLLGLYNSGGQLDHVGFTSNIPSDGRTALTAKLESMVSPPGFTGNAPGGPSRWSTERSTEWQPLRPELVVEVRYDHVTGRALSSRDKLCAMAARKGTQAVHFRAIANGAPRRPISWER